MKKKCVMSCMLLCGWFFGFSQIVDSVENIVMSINLGDELVENFSNKKYFVTFAKSCKECIKMVEMSKDTNSNDRKALRKVMYRIEVIGWVYDIKDKKAVLAFDPANNSLVKAVLKDKGDKDKEVEIMNKEVDKGNKKERDSGKKGIKNQSP